MCTCTPYRPLFVHAVPILISHYRPTQHSTEQRFSLPLTTAPKSAKLAPMLFSCFLRSVILLVLLSRRLLATATATATSDPCVKIAGLQFADPADAIACQKSFPFNDTLRQNVLSVVSRVFDFYTFEDFYLNSPPPFQESTTNIRADVSRISSMHYAVSTSSSLGTDAQFMISVILQDRL